MVAADDPEAPGLLSRLRQAVLASANTSPAAPVPAGAAGVAVPQGTAITDAARLLEIHKDVSDDVKMALVAEVASAETTHLQRAFEIAKLVATLKSLDQPGLRTIFDAALKSEYFSGSLKLEALARLMERQPTGTFHDPNLRLLFQRVKDGRRWYRKIEGLDATRRIEAAVGQPEEHSDATHAVGLEPPESPTIDQMLDAWIEAWMRLITELRATGGEIDATMLARSRQVQRIVVPRDEIAGQRNIMNLDDPKGVADFRHIRLSNHNERMEFPTFDPPWLADLRRQLASWRKLGPTPAWSGSAIPGLAVLSATKVSAEQTLVDFLRPLRGAKPTAKWAKSASDVARGSQGPAVRRALIDWLQMLPVPGSARARLWPAVSAYRDFRNRVVAAVQLRGNAELAALISFFDYWAPFRIYEDGSGGFGRNVSDPAILSEVAESLVRSAVWMLASWHDAEIVATLQQTADAMLTKLSVGQGVNYRSHIAGSAAILALGQIATADAVQALGRIKLKVRDERLSKQIAKAMDTAAMQAGVSVADLQEMAVPTFDLDDVGVKSITLGDYTAALRVMSTTEVAIDLARADGKIVKSVPAAVKADAGAMAALKQLKAVAKSIAQALPVHRQRIESLYLTNRSWPLSVWRERFCNHPLVGTLARRLIWNVAAADGTAHALMWHDGHPVDASAVRPIGLADDAVVTLWHPLEAAADEVAAWCAFLMRTRVVQPFKQAHRELYPLTDAERTTGTYSNRFAGHILRQHQSVALARLRGWRVTLRISADVPNDEPTHLRIPEFGLAGEVWTAHAGGDDAEFTSGLAYAFISTDRVRFRRLVPGANGSGLLGQPVPLDEVPPRVFSEVMRDVDLMVGVASIGNDPTWNDGGADALHPSQWRRTAAQDYWNAHSTSALDVAGENRRQFLADLIPSLNIADVCTLSERYLIVRGQLHAYRIHLGSGNILMENDRYLCIVPSAATPNSSGAFLPFEGDRMLSIILSKAVMLASDDKIRDTTILSQINR